MKPHFIPADWKPSEALIAWAVHEFRTPNNEQLTEAEIRNEADSFVDYWTGRRDGARMGLHFIGRSLGLAAAAVGVVLLFRAVGA